MVASEAGLMVDPVIGSQLVNQVDSLVTGGALLCGSGEGGGHCLDPLLGKDQQEQERAALFCPFFLPLPPSLFQWLEMKNQRRR